MGWVENDARDKALQLRDGPEKWRDVKQSISQAVTEYTRIYTPAGAVELQYADCLTATENCVRVRTVPKPGENDVSYEITFDPEKGTIQCNKAKDTFSLRVVSIGAARILGIVDCNGRHVSSEDISRRYLSPLFSNLPPRPPNITM